MHEQATGGAPPTGAEARGCHRSCWIGCGSVLALALLFGLWASHDMRETGQRELKGRILYQGGQLFVTNQDAFTWEQAEIIVNCPTMSLFGGWRLRAGDIPAGAQRAWWLPQFTDGSGERFDPARRAVKTVSVRCRVGRGTGFCYGEFQ